jgi:hypothetical protein
MVSFKIGNAVLRAKRVTYALLSRSEKSRIRACEVSVETCEASCFITYFMSSALGLLAIKA